MEPIYHWHLINKNTNKINKIISVCFNHLFQQFGQIDYMQVDILEKKLQDCTWDIDDPPDIFYDIIEYLITVAEDENLTKTNN